jgi:hypothetical protein
MILTMPLKRPFSDTSPPVNTAGRGTLKEVMQHSALVEDTADLLQIVLNRPFW